MAEVSSAEHVEEKCFRIYVEDFPLRLPDGRRNSGEVADAIVQSDEMSSSKFMEGSFPRFVREVKLVPPRASRTH